MIANWQKNKGKADFSKLFLFFLVFPPPPPTIPILQYCVLPENINTPPTEVCFGLKLPTLGFWDPPSPMEFPMTLLGVNMEIFWKYSVVQTGWYWSPGALNFLPWSPGTLCFTAWSPNFILLWSLEPFFQIIGGLEPWSSAFKGPEPWSPKPVWDLDP